MIYAVDKYMDAIKVKKEREYEPFGSNVGTENLKYHYFDTENEARQFIRKRSLDAYYAAEAEVAKAQRRHNKNCKKYPSIKLALSSAAADSSSK